MPVIQLHHYFINKHPNIAREFSVEFAGTGGSADRSEDDSFTMQCDLTPARVCPARPGAVLSASVGATRGDDACANRESVSRSPNKSAARIPPNFRPVREPRAAKNQEPVLPGADG